jgi:hypothetical protein
MTDRKIKKSSAQIDENIYITRPDLSSFHFFDSRRRKIPASTAFETVRRFFSYTENLHGTNENADVDCFALRLCRYLRDKIVTDGPDRESDGSFPETFYRSSLDDAKDHESLKEVDDPELMLIYMKQMVHLMRKAELISPEEDSSAGRKTPISDTSLFMRLFHSFWFYTNWEEIFPSDPDAAGRLHETRTFIRDLVLGCEIKTEISAFSNNLFELTGFAEKNDILKISFLDFYLLTWLKHFGVMRYHSDAGNSPVSIQLTDMGRKLFSNLG